MMPTAIDREEEQASEALMDLCDYLDWLNANDIEEEDGSREGEHYRRFLTERYGPTLTRPAFRIRGKLRRCEVDAAGRIWTGNGWQRREVKEKAVPVTLCAWCDAYVREGHGPDALCPACQEKATASARFFGDTA